MHNSVRERAAPLSVESLLEIPLVGHALQLGQNLSHMEGTLASHFGDVSLDPLAAFERATLPRCFNLIRSEGVELGYLAFGQPVRAECWNTESFGVLMPLSGRVQMKQYPQTGQGLNGPYFLLPGSDLRLQFTEDCSVLVFRFSVPGASARAALERVFREGVARGDGLLEHAEHLMCALVRHTHHALSVEEKKKRLEEAKEHFLRSCGIKANGMITPSWLERDASDVRVLKAAQYLRATSQGRFDLPGLCEETCMSRRGLYYAFRRNLNCTPYGYFKACQLLRVRLALMLDSKRSRSISWHAAAYGFRHMSRFSAQYRQLFGERPRETGARHTKGRGRVINAR